MRLFLKKETQKEHTYTVEGLISGIKYSLANGWAYVRGGLKVGFYGRSLVTFQEP